MRSLCFRFLRSKYNFRGHNAAIFTSMATIGDSHRLCQWEWTGCRRFSSHSHVRAEMNPEIAYAKALLKLFLLHVHPDYFLNHEIERKVNESNIKSLTERLTSFSVSQGESDVRSLTFYIKAQSSETRQATSDQSDNWRHKPKRIKIAISNIYRLTDSIKNVLESLGVTNLPEKPRHIKREFASDMSSHKSGQHYEVKEFFDILIDQHELINLRKDTANYSKQLLSRVQMKLGVDKISMQSNLSSVNAYALIRALLDIIDSNHAKLYLPWKGLELVISGNDIPVASVDAVEAIICINPTQTPNQWMQAFLNVNAQTFQVAHECKRKIEMLSQNASKTIRKIIVNNVEANSTRVYKNVKYSWKNKAEDIVIRLKKGFTCSNELYIHFLETHFPLSNLSTSISLPLNISDSDDANQRHDINKVHVNFGNVNREKEYSKAITKQAMIVEVTVEHGYGTKVLESGEVRLDANLRPSLLDEFIARHTSTILTNTVRNIRRRNELELLRQKVVQEVGIESLSRGVGITDDMFERFLRMMLDDDESRDHRQRKRAMKDFDVRVSRYLGVSDDGFILVPWDVELAT